MSAQLQRALPAENPATAVALAYEEGAFAPRVVAKGSGTLAREILRRAGEAGVYVHQSPELVSLLMRVDLDEHIPPELYMAISELLAWLYRADKQRAPQLQLPPRQLPPRQAPQRQNPRNAR